MPAGIDDALALVADKFRGMTDKDGEPYVMHCLRVMMGTDDPAAQLVGLMHDLVEDTDVTLDDLRASGFAEQIVEAVDLVTHKPGDGYADYVVRIMPNQLARSAKMSDLRDNAAMGRVLCRSDRRDGDLRRIERYVLSYKYLDHQIDEAEYRARMAQVE